MANFIKETEYMIETYIGKDYEVDELIIRLGWAFDRDEDMTYKQTGGKINWVKMSQHLGIDLAEYDYDSGFGNQEFGGWITFKNSNKWLERKEYDGSEWWEVIAKPTLKDEQ